MACAAGAETVAYENFSAEISGQKQETTPISFTFPSTATIY